MIPGQRPKDNSVKTKAILGRKLKAAQVWGTEEEELRAMNEVPFA